MMTCKLAALFKKSDKTKLIVLLGIVGILLIFLSSVLGGERAGKKTSAGDTAETGQSQQGYLDKTQTELQDILSHIDGVGEVEILITLERSEEKNYVYEEKKSTDSSDGSRVSSRESLEKSCILIDGENGQKDALVQSTSEPLVKGVLIVCAGGGDSEVVSQVLDAVTTLLDIPSNRVCITQKK